MYIEVYLDIIFIINFIFNFAILKILSFVFKESNKNYKLIIASFISGSLGTVLFTLNLVSSINYLCAFLLIGIINILISFKYKNIKDLLIKVLLLYIVSFTSSGFIDFIYYQTHVKIKTFKFLIVLIIILTLIFKVLIKKVMKIKKIENNIYNIKLKYMDKYIETKGLVDTGNCLYDFASKKPVIIIERNILDHILEDDMKKEIDNLKNIKIRESLNYIDLLKYKIIPFKSIGNNNGYLIGIVLDEVLISSDIESFFHKDVIAGIYDEDVFLNKNYKVILHQDLL